MNSGKTPTLDRLLWRGLAPLTAQELTRLGYKIIDSTENTVRLRGGMRDMMTLNPSTLPPPRAGRCCEPPAATCATSTTMSIRSTGKTNDVDGYFTVNSVVRNETVRDTRMPSLTTKDAIVDRIRDKRGGRPDSGRETYGAAVFVYWINSELIIYIDTTGEPLSKRGYRKNPGVAPMQETLAAGCVLASGWDGNSPFVVPMCGSGTPAIEAALYAINRAPGSFKSHFGFMAIKGYRRMIPGEKAGVSVRQRFGATPEQIWKDMVAVARQQERRENLPPIIATDVSEDVVETAHLNAIAAGLANT